MNIRPALPDDAPQVYQIGMHTPELNASATEAFMENDEFAGAIENKDSIFLIAEEGSENGRHIVGFLYADTTDKDRPLKHKYACLVYLAVIPAYRNKGIATALYRECEERLRKRGITHMYGWANRESKEIQGFLRRQGFTAGKACVWMDKKL